MGRCEQYKIEAQTGMVERSSDLSAERRIEGADKERTLARLRGLRSDLIDPAIAAYAAAPSSTPATRGRDPGMARSLGWKVHMRCANGYRESTRSMRRCVYRKQLDLETLVCTRGPNFSLT
jgi:hypothetical protein